MQGLQDDSSSSETTMKSTLKTREPDIAKTHKPSNVDILSKTSSKQREQNITEDQQRGEHAELLDFFNGNEDEANKFIKEFNYSISAAVSFANNFENPKTAEEYLLYIQTKLSKKLFNSCGAKCK